MAGLTERLPLTSETNRILDDPAGPSALGTIAAFASDTLQGYVQIRQAEAEKRAAAAKEAEKARKAESTVAAIQAHDLAVGDVVASSQTAPGVPEDPNVSEAGVYVDPETSPVVAEIFGGATVASDMLSPEFTQTVKQVGQEVNNVKAAVDQGRMPPISLKAAMSGRFNSLIERYPDQAEHILDIWKKMGIDGSLFRAGKDLGDQLDETREAGQRQDEDERKFMQNMFEVGAKAAGDLMATGGADGAAMTREEVIAHGLKITRAGHEFELAKRDVDLSLSRANLTQQERTQGREDLNTVISNRLENAIFNGTNPVIRMVQNLGNAILKESDPVKHAKRWQDMGVNLHEMIGNQVENAVQMAIKGGYTGDTNTLRSRFQARFKSVEDLFTGEFSVAQAHMQALNTITTAMKIDASEALPVYTTLKGLGMDPATIVGFAEGLSKNADLSKKLRDEIKGFSGDFARDRASDRMINIVKMLRGEETLGYMPPSTARARMPDLYNVSETMSRRYARGLGGNPDMVLNGLGEITIAVNSLAPGSGSKAHIVGIEGILGRDQIAALKKLNNDGGVDKVMATATIQAARAGGAHALNNFQTVLPKLNQNPYFKLLWDDKNGRYKIDDSGLRRAIKSAEGNTATLGATAPMGTVLSPGRASGLSSLRRMEPPEEMRNWRVAANTALDGIMALKTEDPSTPAGSDLELRNYYGRNITPKSLQGGGGTSSIDIDKEIDTQFNALERTIDENLTKGTQNVDLPAVPTGPGARTATNLQGKPVVMPSVQEIEAKYGDTPVFKAVRAAAEKFDVPADIITRLVYQESKYGNPGPNRANASGPMQIVSVRADNGKDVHEGAVQKIFGKSVKDLTPEENIQYGVALLRKLYETHGNWEDAISAYHSGGPLKKRQNSDDGHLKTKDYVSLIR